VSAGIIAKAEIIINAPAARVWKALTDPAEVKQYLFGTNMIVSEWKVGGTILYKGVWQGKEYTDKGNILKYEPEKLLVTSYWSGLSGKADIPENYQIVSYSLSPAPGGTRLIITQENIVTEESKKHSEANWVMVLTGIKKLIEA
jgi:uncharacterized protein YndB with AHSA1/START domain